MQRFSTLSLVLALAACADTPTSPTSGLAEVEADASILALHGPGGRGAGERASVTTIDFDGEACDRPTEDAEVCTAQSGRFHVVETPSGVESFSVTNLRLVIRVVERGVVTETTTIRDRAHTLTRDGDLLQLRQRTCTRLESGDVTIESGFARNLANGLERRYALTTSGCRI